MSSTHVERSALRCKLGSDLEISSLSPPQAEERESQPLRTRAASSSPPTTLRRGPLLLLLLVASVAGVLITWAVHAGVEQGVRSEEDQSFCIREYYPVSNSTGKTNGIERRRLSWPGQTQSLPDGYCEEVYSSVLGKAVPDCQTGQVVSMRRAGAPNPWWKRWGETEGEAVDTLMRNMTREEKEGLLRGFGWKGYQVLPGHYIGNTLAVPRLGVPSINMQDASSGFRTIDQSIEGTVTQWPSMMALSASWDDQLTYDLAAAIGREFRLKGANVILGPGVNVQRVARNGRNAEYISGEEPALGARLATAYVRGVQSSKVAAVVKHFVLNNQETDRSSMGELAE
ncbi:MAG: hypothetical protein SGPRY_014792 [Prymnesium sp.]